MRRSHTRHVSKRRAGLFGIYVILGLALGLIATLFLSAALPAALPGALSERIFGARRTITVPEGYELRQIFVEISEVIGVDVTELIAVEKSAGRRRDLAGFDVESLEGLILPLTYSFPRRSTPLRSALGPAPAYQVLERMIDASRRELHRRYAESRPVDFVAGNEPPNRVYCNSDFYRKLIIASLIEKETADYEERYLVSSVIHNRLRSGMKLELCSSVLYVLPEERTTLSEIDKSNLSGYNTYRYAGLPPSPIGSPGFESIDAALDPAGTDLLYFRLDGNRTHRFSNTYTGHLGAFGDDDGVDATNRRGYPEDSGASNRDLSEKSPAIAVEELTLSEKIGQMLIVGFWGREPNEDITRLINQGHVGGIIFYKRNFPGGNYELKELIRSLRTRNENSRLRLLMCLDQEGGTVNRIDSYDGTFPSAGLLGTRSPDYTYTVALDTGRALAEVGINLNFAPVLDLYYREYSDFFRTRAFSSDPAIAAEHGAAFAKGLIDAGVFPVVKHFPGQGMMEGDVHNQTAMINKDLKRLEHEDLYPFRRVLESFRVGVMMSHAVYPQIDYTLAPASQSEVLMQDILRERLGFDGPVFVDEIEMIGFASSSSIFDGAVAAIENGADVLLVGHSIDIQVRLIEELHRAVQTGRLSTERVDEAAGRIIELKESFGLVSEASF